MDWIIVETHSGDRHWPNIERNSPQTAGYIADPNDRSQYRCFVAVDGDNQFNGLCIIALGRLGFGPLAEVPVACLENILVADNCRRQGIGEALLRTAMSAAWESGAEEVWWTVDYESKGAVEFYHRMGACFIAEEDPDAKEPERYYSVAIANPKRCSH